MTLFERTVPITLGPAHRLPALLRRGLPHLAPAALAGLVATALATTSAPAAGAAVPGVTYAALAVAALVAWRSRHPALPVLAAVAVTVVAEVLT